MSATDDPSQGFGGAGEDPSEGGEFGEDPTGGPAERRGEDPTEGGEFGEDPSEGGEFGDDPTRSS